MPSRAPPATTSTDLQQQIFGALPSSLPAPPTASAPVQQEAVVGETKGEAKGVKRGRDDDSEEEVAMDEDSDAPMEEASDDDEDDDEN